MQKYIIDKLKLDYENIEISLLASLDSCRLNERIARINANFISPLKFEKRYAYIYYVIARKQI